MSKKTNEPCKVEDSDYHEVEQFESEGEYYYIKAFKRLDKTGKHTWNWAAFLFGSQWMLYRKMYLYSCLFLVISVMLSPLPIILSKHLLLIKSESDDILSIMIFFWFIPNVLLGYFGNAVYYKAIEKRIQKGYHLLDKYCPTSIPSILSGVTICFADWIARKCQLKTDVKSEFNEETVRAYLNPNKKIHIAVKIANVLVCFFFLIGLIAK